VSPVKYELGFYIPEDDIPEWRVLSSAVSYSILEVLSCGNPSQKHA
jgi:hypothetical protein